MSDTSRGPGKPGLSDQQCERDEPRADPRRPQGNVLQGTGAASARAIGTQIVNFYFRAPVKHFTKMRVDYMQVARAINPAAQTNRRWSFALSTPGLLAHAVREHGWVFIHRQVLPPMAANIALGSLLYSSYLQALGVLHKPSSLGTKRACPPAPFVSCFSAGFAAGTIQSVAAAPLDALQVRFKVSDLLDDRYKSVTAYARNKLREIGVRGVFAGYTLSFLKEAFGYGLFFSSFEYIKQQAFFSYITWYYAKRLGFPRRQDAIQPHFAIEPTFILLAGITASVCQQLVQHPLTRIQKVHYGRLESIDYTSKLRRTGLGEYRAAYIKTVEQCRSQATKAGGWRPWAYKGFVSRTLRQVPSTSAGLIVFELMRRRFSDHEGQGFEYEGQHILLV